MAGCLKASLTAVGLILILGAVVCLLLLTQAGHFVDSKTTDVLHRITGVELSVERVHVSPLRQRAVISGLGVGNPAGFGTGDAIWLSRATVEVDAKTLFSESPVIKRIHVEGPRIYLRHVPGKGTNLGVLAQAAEQARITSQNGRGRFTVKEFVCEQGTIQFPSDAPAAAPEIPLPAITLTHLSQSQMNLAALTDEYLKAVIKQIPEKNPTGKGIAAGVKKLFHLPADKK